LPVFQNAIKILDPITFSTLPEKFRQITETDRKTAEQNISANREIEVNNRITATIPDHALQCIKLKEQIADLRLNFELFCDWLMISHVVRLLVRDWIIPPPMLYSEGQLFFDAQHNVMVFMRDHIINSIKKNSLRRVIECC
jgi:hypothetical protein